MNGKYVGYVAGEDPLHGFLSTIMRDRLEVREPQLARCTSATTCTATSTERKRPA
jgi:hypothetical protein